MRGLPLVILFCTAWGSAPRAEDGGPSRAALEALRGHPKQARAMLRLPQGDPAQPASLVVLASIALDEGDVREAARLVARLRDVAPTSPEARHLDALVTERVARPRADWIAIGLAAVEKVQPLASAEPAVMAWDGRWDGRPLPFPEDAAAKLSVERVGPIPRSMGVATAG